MAANLSRPQCVNQVWHISQKHLCPICLPYKNAAKAWNWFDHEKIFNGIQFVLNDVTRLCSRVDMGWITYSSQTSTFVPLKFGSRISNFISHVFLWWITHSYLDGSWTILVIGAPGILQIDLNNMPFWLNMFIAKYCFQEEKIHHLYWFSYW